MKAIIQCELICSCCKRPMQWSVAIDNVKGERVETDYVACRSLKCEQRNKRYAQPTVGLVKLGEESLLESMAEVGNAMNEKKCGSTMSPEGLAMLDKSHPAAEQPKPKRKYTRKDVKG